MIRIKTFIFSPFQENTFVLSDESGECIIVDPGCYDTNEQEAISRYINDNNFHCSMLVNTHCHIDHIFGNAYIDETFHPQVAAHSDDIFLLDQASLQGNLFGITINQPPKPTILLEEGIDLKFGNSTLRILHVPGHSPGSIALYSPEQNFIIVGDVLFKGSIGRTDLAGGDYDVILNSIYKKLMVLPPDTIVYPGHGPKTTIHEEALSNPFLA